MMKIYQECSEETLTKYNVEVNYIQVNSIINPGQFKKDNAPVAAGRAALEVLPHMKQLAFHPEM